MENLNLLWAILTQLVSTSLNFIGMSLQKKAANSMDKIGNETNLIKIIRNFLTSKQWMFGYFLNIISAILAALALALAAISIIQPLYGFGLIILVIFARFYIKEKITYIDLIGILIGIIGIVIIGITARPPENLSYSDLVSSFLGLQGIIFLSIALGLAILLYIFCERTPRKISLTLLIISSSIWTSIAYLFAKGISSTIRDLGFIDGLFSLKGIYSWIFIGLFIFVSAIGLIMLNIAYQIGQCVIILPIWASIQIVLPVLAGIIIFEEWINYSITTIACQTLGIVVILASVVILAISDGKKEDQCKNVAKINVEKKK